jgi:hypothetical protein
MREFLIEHEEKTLARLEDVRQKASERETGRERDIILAYFDSRIALQRSNLATARKKAAAR